MILSGVPLTASWLASEEDSRFSYESVKCHRNAAREALNSKSVLWILLRRYEVHRRLLIIMIIGARKQILETQNIQRTDSALLKLVQG